MLRTSVWFCICLLLIGSAVSVSAQQPVAASTGSIKVVPPLVSFSGVLTDENGKPLTTVVGVNFALYKDSQGGVPLWLETQNVYPNKGGHFTVMLGATTSTGVPTDIFVAGEARWLGVQAQGQEEQPRVFLLSVPYALKAADAQTVGGLPASAFVLAAPPSLTTGGVVSPRAAEPPLATGTTPVTTAGGTVNKLAKFDATADITNSQVFDNGTNVGIGNTAPTAKLDVSGSETVRGTLTLPATSTATSTAGAKSQPQNWIASSYNSGTAAALNQTFQWRAESTGNNTTSPSATLNLLFGSGTSSPVETGLRLSNKGLFIFATGQTFPGMGTITGVSTASGSGLSGGGTTGTVSLSLLKTCSANQSLQWNGSAWTCSSAGTGTITGVTAGTDLTGGGTSGNVTLSLDTTKVPQLNSANTFTGSQAVNGNLSATGTVTGSSFAIGSNLFAFGSYANQNAFLGFAGNATTTGSFNTASGFAALKADTTGVSNTASGYQALAANTTGGTNTATGYRALFSNTTGSYNTAYGIDALYFNNGGANTATGSHALYSNTTGMYNTASGDEALYSNTTGTQNTAAGLNSLYSNTTGNDNTASGAWALNSNTVAIANTGIGSQALFSNVGDSAKDGWYNTAVGYQALYFNNDTSATGSNARDNTAVGYQALYSNTTGSYNTAFGSHALSKNNTSGSSNAAYGSYALSSNTTGNDNAAFGVLALVTNGTGHDNTAVGISALQNNSTGNYNTAVGVAAGPDVNNPNLTNATVIGAFATVSENNALILGGTGSYAVRVGIGTTTPNHVFTIGQGAGHAIADGWDTYSSRRWKTNIHTLHGALARVEQLRGVSYDLKANGKHEVGVIAEEVGAVVPEVVTWEKDGKDAQSVDYGRLTALLIEATKEQQALIHQQLEQIRVQQAQIKAQQTQIARLGVQVKVIQAALKTNDRTGSEVRTVKAEGTAIRQ